ncbi:unnamed protein product [Clonostachys rosea]|uniref:Extracellular membrane protein CFEM domain-containing protein n=1 Tax=Bionectria ochroleuca TaxID=29856 RepID=A0ABY6UYX6_BIOOC|nr:unnamed protein product [Clonostachys rosea]
MAENSCSGMPWGFLATDVLNAPKCITSCRAKFIDGLLLENKTLESVCEHLSDNGNTATEKLPPFWDLYCCDSQLCGVDNLKSHNLDRTVNPFPLLSLLSSFLCHLVASYSAVPIGYPSLTDPGPPEPTRYICNRISDYGGNPLCQKEKPDTNVATSTGIEHSSVLASPVTHTLMATSTSESKSILDPSLEASLDPSSSDNRGAQGGTHISKEIKVTIGLSVVAGAIVIGLIIFCLLRLKARPAHRRGIRKYFKRKDDDSFKGLTGSPTPLISPTSLASPPWKPLTPPPPLKERKMLNVPPASSRPSSVNREHRQAEFPASPVVALTRDSLVPRTERRPTFNGANTPPPKSPTETAGGARSPTSNTTFKTTQRGSQNQRKPCEVPPLNIGGLSKPGPPPCRALPSTPVSGQFPQSPLQDSSPSSRPGNFGVALGLVSHNPAQGVVLDPEARSLRELTEECERESRNNSWGSWRGSVGGYSPTLSPPNKSKKREFRGQVLQEGDLERLGGKY